MLYFRREIVEQYKPVGYHTLQMISNVFIIANIANDISRLSKPLQSRFRRLHLPKYTKQQFLDVAIKVCPRLTEETALMIGKEVWNMKGDVRDIISIGKLVREDDGPTEIEQIMKTLSKYGGESN
jgi:ATP-dependent Lon protease